MRSGWRDYLAGFHDERPGITEQVLTRARDARDRDPYDWLAEALPRGRVLDLACGSAPLADRVADHTGVDLSAAELALARARGARVLRGDVTRLPVASGSVDAVACSMALMLVPLAETLREARRVLRPGGLLVALVPSSGPLPPGEAWRWGRLLVDLRLRRFAYPNELDGPQPLPGLDVLRDERAAFRCAMDSADVPQLLLRSLYLPGVPEERLARGAARVAGWEGDVVTTPLRLLVARRGSD